MNNRFVLNTRVLNVVTQKKNYEKYAVPTKPGPCFLQYHIALANLFLPKEVTYKEIILRHPISHLPIVHHEVGYSRLLAGPSYRNDSLPAIYEANRPQKRISYLTLPKFKCTNNLTIFVKTARYNKASHGQSNRQALREYIKWMRPNMEMELR